MRPLLRSGVILGAASAVATLLAACSDSDDSSDIGAPALQVMSTKAEYVTGGDALIDIALPDVPVFLSPPSLEVKLNGADVSSAFSMDPDRPGHAIGLVEGLANGVNTLEASYGGTPASIQITNYPVTGPVLSGPQVQPFICQTQDFTLPDGSKLPAATDEHCSVPTVVHYLYRSTAGGALVPLPGTTGLPNDVATTTTLDGVEVPFVVRVETGTMNRGIYQNAVLHDPTRDPAPAPTTPPPGWNKRVIGVHGSGCTGGWYVQGAAMGISPYTGDNLERLAEGYGVFVNTLNHPSNSCNATVAGESTMMGKEHFIETFGVPRYTVSTGCSGGAYTSLQVADAYPGLFDGVIISCTYPDALAIAMSGMDSKLLSRYLLTDNVASFTEEQMTRVSGHKTARAWYDLALQSGRTDPVPGRTDPIPAGIFGGYNSAVWNPAVPANLRFDPVSNPGGARPTVFDVARSVYGVDRATGYALRPFDNVGVQYGLNELKAGVIDKAQFLDLNERIGGYDDNGNYTAARSVGSRDAMRRAHQSGLMLGGGGGLASIPVFDYSGIYDDDQAYHYQWFHFAVRERMAQANGHADNHLMWRGAASITDLLSGDPSSPGAALNQAVATQAWDKFIEWMNAYTADTSQGSQLEKVVRAKQAVGATDGCFTQSPTPQFIAEPQTLSSAPDSQCNTLWPSWTTPRIEAGGPVAANNLKCELKPIDAADYAPVVFDAMEQQRLNAIFPDGVCDWSKPGVEYTGVVPWPSFGPSPVNLVFDLNAP
ncbi:MAG: hypothetical protein GX644_07460 [Limnobacter sp.]|nr:hypothetical protein [Limnobacter sp.]